MLRYLSAGVATLIVSVTGSVIAAGAAQAATCPAVAPGSGTLTPPASPGVDWSGCDLTGADFSGADISGANLSDANLTQVNLTNANTDGANFSGADLFDSNAFGAALTNSNFTNADLTYFEASDLNGSDLQGADISGVNFGTASLTHVKSGNLIATQPPDLPFNWALFRGWLIGPGTDFSGTDLSGWDLSSFNLSGGLLTGTNLTTANLTDANVAYMDVQGANFTGVTLTGVESGGITGTPSSVPASWMLASGYLVGPLANLVSADLAGANLTGADMAGADLYLGSLNGANLTNANLRGASLDVVDLTGVTWSNTTCPDGFNTGSSGTCVGHIDDQAPAASPVISGTTGADGWYTSAVTVTWNWAAGNSAIDPAHCTTSSTSASQGDPVTLTATCLNVLGGVGTATEKLKIDTTPPQVSVTGVSNNHLYALGHVPAAGCSTTDSLSGVARNASVKVTTTGSNGVGPFTATCSGAADKAGNKRTAVSAHYTIAYGFRGFIAPKPGATLAKSAHTITVRFRLVNAAGDPISASRAAALAKAGDVRARLSGPGISAVTVTCSWNTTTGYFQCSIKTPSGVQTGTSHPYKITARENVGTGLVTAPVIGTAANPETVYFK